MTNALISLNGHGSRLLTYLPSIYADDPFLGSFLNIFDSIWLPLERQIDQLYATYLHRAADSAGRAGWVQALMLGMSEADVTRQFLLSQEYTATHSTAADFVNGLYADLFNRQATAYR